MQSSDRVLAGRYAAALFSAAAERGEDQKIQAELSAAGGVFASESGTLRHPRVAAARKKDLLRERLGASAGKTVLRFLELLVDRKRLELLPLIAATCGRLAAQKRGAVRAVVRSARAVSPEARARLEAGLKNFIGKSVELDIKEDPELIGGASVKIGDWVLDSSLRGQLRRMRESIHGH